jgi:hypothetical protein
MGTGGAERDKLAEHPPSDDLDQSPDFDPTEPEPIPEENSDQSWSG